MYQTTAIIVLSVLLLAVGCIAVGQALAISREMRKYDDYMEDGGPFRGLFG